jgi:hypothetical protein
LSKGESTVTKIGDAEFPQEYSLLYECCVLGDLLQDHRFYNSAIDAMIQIMTEEHDFPTHLAKVVCDNLPSRTPLSKLIVDNWVYNNENCWYDLPGDPQQAPAEFWVAIARKMSARLRDDWQDNDADERDTQRNTWPWVEDRCQYHIHPKGEPRCS